MSAQRFDFSLRRVCETLRGIDLRGREDAAGVPEGGSERRKRPFSMLEERAIEEEALAKKREQREQAECPTVGVSPGVILCFSSRFRHVPRVSGCFESMLSSQEAFSCEEEQEREKEEYLASLPERNEDDSLPTRLLAAVAYLLPVLDAAERFGWPLATMNPEFFQLLNVPMSLLSAVPFGLGPRARHRENFRERARLAIWTCSYGSR